MSTHEDVSKTIDITQNTLNTINEADDDKHLSIPTSNALNPDEENQLARKRTNSNRSKVKTVEGYIVLVQKQLEQMEK